MNKVVIELNRIRIVKHLILNFFWREMIEDVILEIVGVWKKLIFLHIVRFKELLELDKETKYDFKFLLVFETIDFSCFHF